MWVFSSLAWFGTVVFPFVFVYEHVIMMCLKLRKIKILTSQRRNLSVILFIIKSAVINDILSINL